MKSPRPPTLSRPKVRQGYRRTVQPVRPHFRPRPEVEWLEGRTAPTVYGTNPMVPINDLAWSQSSLTVPDHVTISRMRVRFNIDHTWDDQLKAYLRAPNGQEYLLFNGVGGGGDNFVDTTLDNLASYPLSMVSAPFTGTFRPAQSLTPLLGTDASGVWTFKVYDGRAGEVGTIRSWWLDFTGTALPDLVGTALSINPTAEQWGRPVQVTFTVRNIGYAPSAPTTAQLVASTDPTFSTNNLVVTTLNVAGLAAGAAASAGYTVQLPGTPGIPPPGFQDQGPIYLSMRYDPDNSVPEEQDANNWNRDPQFGVKAFTILPGMEVEPNDTALRATPLLAGRVLPATLGSRADVDWYRVTVSDPANLTAWVIPGAPGLEARLSLFTATGELVVSSEGQASGRGDPAVVQHVPAGDYLLKVEGVAGSTGAYSLQSTVQPASPPFQPLQGITPWVVSADVNGDGRTDIVGAGVVFLGNGDGSFQSVRRWSGGGGNGARGITADLDGNGRIDLITINPGANVVQVYSGNGDGTFQATRTYGVGIGPVGLVAADVNGDGRTDLITANQGSLDVTVLLGNGDGTFKTAQRWSVGTSGPNALAVADVNGDHCMDIITANPAPTAGPPQFADVTVLLGNGDGSFRDGHHWVIEGTHYPVAVMAVDVNGDGPVDLITASQAPDAVAVLLGNGDGSFQTAKNWAGGGYGILAVVAADVNGDGRIDLVTANQTSGDLSVLSGNGDGTFQPAHRWAVGTTAITAMAAADLNADGRTDLVTANTGNLAVLLGNGDGSFQPEHPWDVGRAPAGVVAADVNGDAQLDLIIADRDSNDVAVLSGNGDGSFQAARHWAVGNGPTAVAAADVNGDGRTDLITGNSYSGDLSVLLGNGDGTFQAQRRVVLAGRPEAMTTADLNGDGRTDLITTSLGTYDPAVNPWVPYVGVLLGNGDGSFQPERPWALSGDGPESVVAADLNGDGRTDLVTANQMSHDVSVLLGDGQGSFLGETQWSILYYSGELSTPRKVVVADVTGDGHPDVITSRSVLPGSGDGSFQASYAWGGGGGEPLASADLNGDSHPDLVVQGWFEIYVHLNLGNGTFQPLQRWGVGNGPQAVTVADINGDGRPDLVTANAGSNDISVLLANGEGTFLAPDQIASTITFPPQVADVNGDGVLDTLVLSQQGTIFWRHGVQPSENRYEPPVAVTAPDDPSRGFTVVKTPQGVVIAILDQAGDAVTLYAFRRGTFQRTASLQAGRLPVQILSGDLDGNDSTCLVVRNAGDGTLSLFRGDARGQFVLRQTLDVGLGASDVRLTNAVGDTRPENLHGPLGLLVTNQNRGEVAWWQPDANGVYTIQVRYRAGNGLYDLVADANGRLNLATYEHTRQVVAGQFTADDLPDLITVNPGTNTLGLLVGLGGGRYANPQRLLTAEPVHDVQAADLNRDGYTDLVLLGSGRATVWFGGPDAFRTGNTYDVTPDASGLTLQDVTGDGKPDLLVGNPFGDVLVLPGNGDGTFQPYRRADHTVTLAVADLNGDGKPDAVLGDRGFDRVRVQFGDARAQTLRDRTSGLLAPDAVRLVDLNRDGVQDLVVANGGGNTVIVYLGLRGGGFGPGHGFFTGTSPAGVTVGDLNGDGRPDLVVANQGSNDVTVLLGQGDGAAWTFTNGPRLRAGTGPVSTTLVDATGDGRLDLLVTDRGSADVRLLPGIGGGFFNDTAATVYALPPGSDPRQTLAGFFDGRPGLDFVTVNYGSNTLTVVSDFAFHPSYATYGSGGAQPVDALGGDFNGDGYTDLLVANHGDGVLALFDGGVGGLNLQALLAQTAVAHPTALAQAGEAFYVAGEGVDAAIRFLLPGAAEHPAPPETLAGLVPLNPLEAGEAAATVLTVITAEAAAAPAAGAGPAVVVPGLRDSGDGGTAEAEAKAWQDVLTEAWWEADALLRQLAARMTDQVGAAASAAAASAAGAWRQLEAAAGGALEGVAGVGRWLRSVGELWLAPPPAPRPEPPSPEQAPASPPEPGPAGASPAVLIPLVAGVVGQYVPERRAPRPSALPPGWRGEARA